MNHLFNLWVIGLVLFLLYWLDRFVSAVISYRQNRHASRLRALAFMSEVRFAHAYGLPPFQQSNVAALRQLDLDSPFAYCRPPGTPSGSHRVMPCAQVIQMPGHPDGVPSNA
jgi:hypothetical protein